MTPKQYVDLLRTKTRTGTDYAVAKLLKVTEQSVYAWRDNNGAMDNWAAMETARALDMPLEQVIADMEAFREKRPERQKVWSELAGKFGGGGSTDSCTTIGTSSDHTAPGQDRPRKKGPRILFDIMRSYATTNSQPGLPPLYNRTLYTPTVFLRQISRLVQHLTGRRLAV